MDMPTGIFRFDRRLAVRATVLATALLLGAGWATPSQALTREEILCRDRAARIARTAVTKSLQIRLRCVNRRMHGFLDPTDDCLADPEELGGPGTGDLKTDRRLVKLRFKEEKAAARLAAGCDNKRAAFDVDPVDLDLEDACAPDPDTSEWGEVGRCLVDIGQNAAKDIAEVLDAAGPGPVSDGHQFCMKNIASQVRATTEALLLWRAKCFLWDDFAAVGGGVYECGATVMPFGTVETTFIDRADKRMGQVFPKFDSMTRALCDVDIDQFDVTGVTPENTGGRFDLRWTVDDVIHAANDRIQQATNTVNFGATGAEGLWPIIPLGGFCGDGTQDAGEECDDGNNISCDGCDRDCTIDACGNGAVCKPEECDDGNNIDGDGCTSACISELCMNGTVNPGWDEECDDGVESVGCDTDCTLTVCGDQLVNVTAGETCDEGTGLPANQAVDTATCDGDCSAPLCPDGYFNPFNTNPPAPVTGEECDEGGDTVNCDGDCTPALCGDGYTNAARGEQCDDANNAADDSCVSSDDVPSSDCQTAFCGDGFTCTDGTCTSGPGAGVEQCDDGDGTPSSAESPACNVDCSNHACGDGNLNVTAGEECDDGDAANDDLCISSDTVAGTDCKDAACGDGWTCTAGGCNTGPGGAAEQCDDGNGVNTDPCLDDCSGAACGDSVVCSDGGCTTGPGGQPEECDDGGESVDCDVDCSAQACGDSTVNTSAGELCDTGGNSATCDSDCTTPLCGDSLVNPSNTNAPATGVGEQCDAGGETTACDTNCTTAFCGDGDLNAARSETCDDGNDDNTDTCPDDISASGTCATATCGDGFTCSQGGCNTAGLGPEDCDDADANNNNDCTNVCVDATCGDGLTWNQGAGTEQCDDADANNNNDCVNACQNAFRGDGITWNQGTGAEQCDDADANDNNDCVNVCQNAFCGDGIIWNQGTGIEVCDDGVLNGNPGQCNLTCSAILP